MESGKQDKQKRTGQTNPLDIWASLDVRQIKLHCSDCGSEPTWLFLTCFFSGNGGSSVEQTLGRCSTYPSMTSAARGQSSMWETIRNNLTLWNNIIPRQNLDFPLLIHIEAPAPIITFCSTFFLCRVAKQQVFNRFLPGSDNYGMSSFISVEGSTLAFCPKTSHINRMRFVLTVPGFSSR